MAESGAFELPDDVAAALIELESMEDDSQDSDEPTEPVGAPLKPRPHLNSGAITLPEPD
jgi:hypothetical protein